MQKKSTDYISLLLHQYLLSKGVRCDLVQLQMVLESAPSFPSVLSITQALSYFGVKGKAYNADYDGLQKIVLPAIVHLSTTPERFIMVISVTENNITYYDALNRKQIVIGKLQFLNIWSGSVVISLENTKQTIVAHSEKKFNQSQIKKTCFIFSLCIVFIGYYLQEDQSENNITVYFLLFLKIIGIVISFGLILHEFGSKSRLLDLVCKSSQSFDCERVLQSASSRLFNFLPLSIIGAWYFLNGATAILLAGLLNKTSEVVPFLFYLSICCIPYVIFSVAYQKVAVKKWCPLCLMVMIVILLENGLFLLSNKANLHVINYANLLYIFFTSSIIASTLLYATIIRISTTTDKLKYMKSEIRIKRNPSVIFALFRSRPFIQFNVSPNIAIGNKSAEITITTIINPSCEPCKNMALKMLQLVKNYPDSILWNIRFDGFPSPENSLINEVQLYLLQAYENLENKANATVLIQEWFNNPSLTAFLKKYPTDRIDPQTVMQFYHQVEDNIKIGIKKVPYLCINNRILPDEYRIEDISYLLTDLPTLSKVMNPPISIH